ncbi:MAG: carbohydrate-binding protein, partial [Bacteroidota bacterium]
TPPSAAAASTALMELAEDFKMENTVFQKDVIDAMFRQVYSDETRPYTVQNIPGIVYTTDFDMGVVGEAYFDNEVANYQVTTGNFTSWNNGWVYRNDGVDIERTQDNINTNGYNIGWLGTGEWMQYSVDVATSAVYDVEIRVASNGTDGRFHLEADGADITGRRSVPGTGGWQNWQTITVPDVILDANDRKIRFYVDAEGFNLGSMKFVQKGATTTLPTTYQSAITLDDQSVQLSINKPLISPIPASPADFSIFVDGSAIPITAAVLDTDNPRIITFTVNHTFKSSESIKISYNGTQITATDGSALTAFTLKDVQNTVAIIHGIPGRVQAEDYYRQFGIQLENTSDAGGGQNIGFLDVGDYADYIIDVGQAGTYNVTYRTAAESEMGGVEMFLVDASGGTTSLHSLTFPSTGGWQTWANTSRELDLPAGRHTLRLSITAPLFNINWFEFSFVTSVEKPASLLDFRLFPNPGEGVFQVEGRFAERQDVQLEVFDLQGRSLWRKGIRKTDQLSTEIDLRTRARGLYFLRIRMEDGSTYTERLVYR